VIHERQTDKAAAMYASNLATSVVGEMPNKITQRLTVCTLNINVDARLQQRWFHFQKKDFNPNFTGVNATR
jgi:hypothetical protein